MAMVAGALERAIESRAMKRAMKYEQDRDAFVVAGAAAAVLLIAIGAYFAVYDDWPGAGFGDASTQAYAQAYAKETDGATPGAAPNRPAADSVDLSDQQLASVKVEPVREHVFPIEKSAVGSIDFNQEMSVQVFTPYQGRIVGLFATIGDEVKKGQTLFTIDSPDLLQAVSTLIAAAGVLEFTTRNLARLKALYATRAVSAKRYGAGGIGPADRRRQCAGWTRRRASFRQDRCRDKQHHCEAHGRLYPGRAKPDLRARDRPQRGAGAVRAARQCARSVFGCRYLHHVDAGERRGVGQPGVQGWPGGAGQRDGVPRPRIRRQDLHDLLERRPEHTPGVVRSEITDPQHELRAGMFANFRHPRRADPSALPGGAARRRRARGRRHHDRHGSPPIAAISPGERSRSACNDDGYRQILEGLQPGELVATEGALFLSNALATAGALMVDREGLDEPDVRKRFPCLKGCSTFGLTRRPHRAAWACWCSSAPG